MDTKPTIETILERLTAMEERFDTRFNGLETRLDKLESRQTVFEDHTETRLDIIEKLCLPTCNDMVDMRIEFRELRKHVMAEGQTRVVS